MRDEPTFLVVANIIIGIVVLVIAMCYVHALWPWGLVLSAAGGAIFGGQLVTLFMGKHR